MIRTKKGIYLMLFATVLFLTFSCDEDNTNVPLIQKSNEYYDNEYNQAMEILSVAYAKALENKEIRSIIKTEALRRFDGDYDVLHNVISSQKINGLNLKSILAKNASTSKYLKSAEIANDNYIDSLASKIKNLQISVPIHCEEWNINNFSPRVIFLPSNFNEKTYDKVKAYDADGSYEWVSSVDEPDVPYIVISPSERVGQDEASGINNPANIVTDANLNIEKSISALPTTPNITSLTYGNPLNHFIKWNETDNEKGYEIFRSEGSVYDKIGSTGMNENEFIDFSKLEKGKTYKYKVWAINNEGHSNWGESMNITASERTSNRRLKITKLSMSKSRLKTVESWLAGAPEIRLYVIKTLKSDLNSSLSGEVDYTSEMMEPGQRKDIQDKWWTIYSGGIKTNQWNVNDANNVRCLNFVWVEEDWEDASEITIPIAWKKPELGIEISASYKIPSSKGELISSQQVYWWDAKTTTYSSGGFGFDLTETTE